MGYQRGDEHERLCEELFAFACDECNRDDSYILHVRIYAKTNACRARARQFERLEYYGVNRSFMLRLTTNYQRGKI